MRTSFFSFVLIGMACGVFTSAALGQVANPLPRKQAKPPQVGAPIKIKRTPPEGEKALKRLPSRRLSPGGRNLSPNQLKSRREQIQQRRLASIRSRISALEAKRAKGRITEKEKSLLNTMRQYLANHQKWLNRERAPKPSILKPAKPPKRSTPPVPPKPATKKK